LADKALKKQQIINGISTDVFWQIVNTFSGFVAVPIILNYTDSEIYGYWLAIISALTYFGMFDFSLGMSLTHAISSVSREKTKKLNQLINTGLVSLVLLGFLILIAGYLVSFFIDNIFNISSVHKYDIILSFRLLVVGLAISLPFNVFSSILVGFNYLSLEKNIKEGVRFVGILFSIILVVSGFGVIGLAIANLFTIVCTGVILLYYSKFIYFKEFALSFKGFQKSIVKKLLSYGGLFQFGKIANTISYSADTIIIGIFLFGSEITIYTISSKLAILIGIAFMSKLPGAYFPTLSKLFSQKDYNSLRNITKNILSYTLRIAIIGSVFLYFGNSSLVTLWVGPEYYAGYNLNMVFISWLMIDAFHRGTSVVIQASGRLKQWALISFLEAVINVLLSIVLIKQYGLFGVAISTTIARLFTSIFFINITCKFIEYDYVKLTIGILITVLFSIPTILMGLVYNYYFINNQTWVNLIVLGLLLLTVNITFHEGIKIYKSNEVGMKNKIYEALEIL
jgi:O-antigen/teichoic acid export membrane protein